MNCGTNTLSVIFIPTDSLDYYSATSSVAIAVFMVHDGINLSDPVQAMANDDANKWVKPTFRKGWELKA